jgi:hypothetical protein
MREIVVRDPTSPGIASFLRESYPVHEAIVASCRDSLRALRFAISDTTTRFWPPLLEPMLPSLRSRARRRSE